MNRNDNLKDAGLMQSVRDDVCAMLADAESQLVELRRILAECGQVEHVLIDSVVKLLHGVRHIIRFFQIEDVGKVAEDMEMLVKQMRNNPQWIAGGKSDLIFNICERIRLKLEAVRKIKGGDWASNG